ncbi:MAG: M48 family metallopeptidase [Dehalococcoidales bacterium]|nr:M48 family metallopeptidase [Dehalococcoidales bacterium]
MTDSRLVQIEDIGEVKLERSKRARRIVITVRPGKGVRVAVPRYTSLKYALQFVRSKKSWIKKHMAKIQTYEKQKQVFEDNFRSIDKAAAKKTIISRLNQLASQHRFTYNRVSIRSQRTRWGSCSAKGDISLNIKLVALPPELADYVILHELVHTRVHNHSKEFWQELDKYTDNGKTKARRLVEYGLGIL